MFQAYQQANLVLTPHNQPDRYKNIKLLWLLRELGKSKYRDYVQLQYQLQCACLDYKAGTSFETHWQQALSLLEELKKLLCPWLQANKQGTSVTDLAQLWVRQFGDIQSKQTQANIQQTLVLLQQLREGSHGCA